MICRDSTCDAHKGRGCCGACTLLCITNSMGTHGCTIRGHHLTTCPDTDTCQGCLPRPANKGILCMSCFEKFEAALLKAVDLITHLRSVEKGPASVVPTRSAPGSRVILPGSWMEADNLWGGLVELALVYAHSKGVEAPVWVPMYDGFSVSDTLEVVARRVSDLVAWLSASTVDVVSRVGGAEAAVKFYRETQRALAMFPLDEKPVRVPYLRCRECGQFTMLDRPPLWYLEPRVMQCANPACGVLYDPQMKEFDLRLYREELEAEMAAEVAGRGSAA